MIHHMEMDSTKKEQFLKMLLNTLVVKKIEAKSKRRERILKIQQEAVDLCDSEEVEIEAMELS